MKKFLSVLMLIWAFIAGWALFAGEALEKFTVTPDKIAASVGDKIVITVEWKAADGVYLYSYYAPIERKNSPKGFFENTKRKINKNPKNFVNYDNIYLIPYQIQKDKKGEGQLKLTVDLADFVPGTYKFDMRAKFMQQDGKQINRSVPITLTVSEDVEKFTVSPVNVNAVVGDELEFTLEWAGAEGVYLYSYYVPIERKNSPKGFFEKTGRKINKNPNNFVNYDNIYLAPYQVLKDKKRAGQIKFTLDLSDFVPGIYKFDVRARFMKGSKVINRIVPVTVTVAPPAPRVVKNYAPGEKAQLRDYIIYVDKAAPPSVKKAAARMQKIIFNASGVRLTISDEPGSPMIAVGASPAAEKAGINAGKIGYDGYAIKKVGNDIFIVGREMPGDGMTPMYGQSFGTTYGVFAFLEKHMGIYHLLPGEKGWYYPEISQNYVFKDVDETFVPRFSRRFFWKISGSNKAVEEWIDYNGNLSNHIGSRYVLTAHVWIYLYPAAYQWQAKYVPTREATFRKNPELFELSGEGRRVMPGDGETFSLCLGNPATTDDMIARIPKIMQGTWEKYPQYKGMKMYSLTPNDNAPYCACERCNAKKRPVTKEMAGDAAYDLNFNWTELCFDSARKICEALPDYQFACNLYHSTQFTYPGIKPMPKNFIGALAPLHCGYGPVRYCDKVNATWHKWIKSWDGLLSEQVYSGLDFWIRQYYGAPQVPGLRLMNETFKVLRERPFFGIGFYSNTGYGQSGMSTWVLSKMMYDPYQDAEKLGQLYMEKAYGAKAAGYMKQLWLLVENSARDFYNMYNGKSGWDMNTEMLADIYAPIYPELEKLYLAALADAGDENQKWRLEMFGANLKLLRFYLVRLGFMPDSESPLRLTEEAYDELNRARMPGQPLHHILSPAPMPLAQTLSSNVKAEITTELAGKSEFKPIAMLANGEMLIMPEKDGIVELEFSGHTVHYNQVKQRQYHKSVEFFNIYDEKRNLLFTGMTDKGIARFKGEKGKLYRFIFLHAGDYAVRPYWYLKRCSEPFAMGHWHDGDGFRVYDLKSPVYFYVEEGTENVDIYWSRMFRNECFVKLYDPSGKMVDSIQRSKATSDELHAKAVPGWWKLEFNGEKGYNGRLRFGYGLTKYMVVDPSRALKIITKK